MDANTTKPKASADLLINPPVYVSTPPIRAALTHRRKKWHKLIQRSIARNPGVTLTKNKNGLPEGKPLIELVAGTGFEPVTFGL